ncbi:MAG TPA: putative toxin-antitoxin system toxin component, PIN family [Armatimonadota bacterium]|jgi:putative PIN family toxin of toxin-antitoxin system
MTRRVVVDTNVMVSALLSASGSPRKVVDHIRLHGTFLASEETVAEIAAVLHRPKFLRYITPSERDDFIQTYTAAAELVTVTERVEVCRDARDDMFLEVALNGRADAIVSGDADLLDLNPFRGILILSPSEYLTAFIDQPSVRPNPPG